MQSIIKISLMLLLILILVACGGDAETSTSGNETQDEVQTQNTTEADTSQDEIIEESSSDPVTLTESYSSDGDMFPSGLAFDYPDGWVVSVPINNILLIATSDAVANKTFGSSAFNAGEAVIQLGLNTRTNSDEAVTDHVTGFAGSIGIPLGDASELTVAGNPAARVDGSNDNRHLMVVSVLFEGAVDVAVGSGDTYIDAVTYSNPDEFDQMEATLLAIIETINYAE